MRVLLKGGAVRVPYIMVGLSRALHLVMTGREVNADEDKSRCLADRVVPK